VLLPKIFPQRAAAPGGLRFYVQMAFWRVKAREVCSVRHRIFRYCISNRKAGENRIPWAVPFPTGGDGLLAIKISTSVRSR